MSVGLVVEILGDASNLVAGLDKAQGSAGGFASGMGGTLLKMGALAGVAGIAGSAIMDMTQAAAADRDEQAKLQAAIEAAGAATGDYTAQVDAAIAAGQERAFTDTETRDAMQSLVTATGDVGLATEQLATAQDLARFAGVDLATAADAVAKAQAGQDGALRKLVPGLEKGATATDTLAAASAQAKGQADAYAKSAAGMQAKAGDAFSELTEEIGGAFLPILDALLPALIPIIQQFGQLVKAILPLLIPLIQLLARYMSAFLGVVSKVVGIIIDLVKWLSNAASAVGDFLDSINPLKNVQLPDLPFLNTASPAGAASAGVGRRAGALPTSSSAAPATITVYTTGDGIEAEQAVARALRRVTRLNGGVVPALSGLA